MFVVEHVVAVECVWVRADESKRVLVVCQAVGCAQPLWNKTRSFEGACMSKTPRVSQAVMAGDMEAVRKLVTAGESIEEPDEVHGTPLIAAILDEQHEIVRLLLELGANPNGPDHSDWDTPLTTAAMNRDVEAVQLLLGHGADPNHIHNDGIPLMMAVGDNDLKIAKLLLEAGADVFLSNRHGANTIGELEECSKSMMTLVRSAATEPNENASLLDAVRVGVANQASLLAIKATSNEKVEAAAEAIKLGQVESLKQLVESGVEPNGRFGESEVLLLHLAIFNGDRDCTSALLEAGADPNLTCEIFLHSDVTALMLAVVEKNAPIARLLLAAGCDIQYKNAAGESALSLARQSGGKRMIKLIESAVDADEQHELTVDVDLFDAAREGRGKVAEQLLANGADPNAADANGKTPWMIAIEHSDANILSLLLANGADLTLPWPRGYCTWGEVVQRRSAVPMVELLLGHVKDPRDFCRSAYPGDAASYGLWFHLCGLKQKGVDRVAELLLERGLDPNERLHNGLTPLMVVAAHASVKTLGLLSVLLNAGADPTVTSLPDLSREQQRQAVLDEMESRGLDVSAQRVMRKHKPMVASDFAKNNSSRKVYPALLALIGDETIEPEAYDQAGRWLKQLVPHSESESFKLLAKEISTTLDHRPRRWSRRKGVLQMRAKLRQLSPTDSKEDTDELQGLESLQDLARNHASTLVYCDIPSDARHEVSVLLFPSAEWSAVVRSCGTSAPNYGLTNRDIVNRLAEIHAEFPFLVQGCGRDFVALRFEPITAFERLEKLLVELCPELADDTATDSGDATEHYQNDGRCFLWWD